MIASAITVVLILMFLSVWISAANRRRYQSVRYEVFQLREDLVKLGVASIIASEDLERNFHALNYVARYVTDVPLLLLLGTALAVQDMGLTQETKEFMRRLEQSPDEVKAWYDRLWRLLLRITRAYAPMTLYKYAGKSHFLGSLILAFTLLWLMCWLPRRVRSTDVESPSLWEEMQDHGYASYQTTSSALRAVSKPLGCEA